MGISSKGKKPCPTTSICYNTAVDGIKLHKAYALKVSNYIHSKTFIIDICNKPAKWSLFMGIERTNNQLVSCSSALPAN